MPYDFFPWSLLSFAIMAKYFPVIFIPFLIIRKEWRLLVAALIASSTLIIPFFLWGDVGIAQYFKGFLTYGKYWSINGGIFEVFHL